ncbi:hypothetical protein A3F28_02545 [Candidatus Uhrbacteria bacterium RIFCSPHIGHO2_12_FULL_57_11]|uniref:YdbS-like PH domain-containing protein n=1 Tax=Candidatus Uhrbacteria bacterium RIFCSPHIGHO2_12_FULL_57_11 TaxID=1802398 RepID=A0A1F7ULZ2_9BACT|nr:MAG: hypothetical protein A3F28_02545 [Candidatus Uhrbacteria bacterium RIFCSPHIGHO2_12_FULL_57_11]
MHLDHLIRQKSYEKLVLLLRRHPIIQFGKFLGFMVLALVPAGVYFLISNVFSDILVGPLSYPILVLGASTYYLCIWLFFFTSFVDYYLDAWIVTNERIVSIEQHSLFARTIAELDLFQIQDVTSEVRGLIPTMFNYGDVHIQTAGAIERFVFEQVPRPDEIRKKIVDLVSEDRKYHMLKQV